MNRDVPENSLPSRSVQLESSSSKKEKNESFCLEIDAQDTAVGVVHSAHFFLPASTEQEYFLRDRGPRIVRHRKRYYRRWSQLTAMIIIDAFNYRRQGGEVRAV